MQPMIEFFSTLVRLFKAIVGAWRRDPQFRTLVSPVFFTLLSGTIFYSLQEGWSIVDAFYFSATTLTIVGLGDLAPTTTIGKLLTVIYIFSGLGLIAGFINTIAKETLSRRTRRRRNEEIRKILAPHRPPLPNYRASENFRISFRNCPKSPDILRTVTSKVEETGRRSPISLLGTNKIEVPDAALAPFRTVSRDCL